MPAKLTKSGPGLASLNLSLRQVQKAEVLVGIPATATLRTGDSINNASLLFLLTHGSPLQNLPATPILEPSIILSQKLFLPHMEAAAKATLDKNPELAEQELNKAGTVAANGAKRYFTEGNNWPPNKPATIRKKGSDKRNIDKGALRRSITHVLQIKP